MFSFGSGELLILAALALLLFGPDKIPQVARTVGKVMREFKKYQDIVQSTIQEQVYWAEKAVEKETEPLQEFEKMTQEGQARWQEIAGPKAVANDVGARINAEESGTPMPKVAASTPTEAVEEEPPPVPAKPAPARATSEDDDEEDEV